MAATDLSLKSATPVLAKLLGLTPTALYERQRALVRAGMLQATAGRGPGSGVRLTPDSLSLLLISMLATDSLSQVAEQTKLFADLKSVLGKCPLTGKKTFAAAMAAFLANDELLRRVNFIGVDRVGRHTRETPKATIFYSDGAEGEKSTFGPKRGVDTPRSSFSVSASLILPLELVWDLR